MSCHIIRRLRFSMRFSLENFAYNHPYLFDTSSLTEHGNPRKRKASCAHPIVYQGKCTRCEEEVGSEYGIGVGFLHQGLRFNFDEADRMRETATRMLLAMGKLHLVLDLDHTLLHSISASELQLEKKYFVDRVNSMDDDDEAYSFKNNRFIRLRPRVRSFLKKANPLFQMTIFTMGTRPYALGMAKLLDPDGVYFGDRIISMEYCTTQHRKNLDVVLAKESNILILDDTAAAWPNNQDNLILMEPYNYYNEAWKKEVPVSQKVKREVKETTVDTALPRVFKVLEGIHRAFFNSKEELQDRDVRKLLKLMKSTRRCLSGAKGTFVALPH